MRHKCLAVFLVFLLYFTVTGIIVFWELRMITATDFLTKTFKEANVYQNIAKMANTLAAESDFQTKVLMQYYAENMPPDYLQNEIEKNFQPFLTYLNGESAQPNVVFDLRPFKSRIESNTNQLNAIISDTVEQLPVCTAEQEQELLSQTQNEQTNEGPPEERSALSCRPANMSAEAMAAELKKKMNIESLTSPLPDSYNLATDLKNPDQTFRAAKLAFKIIRWGFWVNLILTFILMGFLVLLGRSWWPSIPRWIGWSLVLPSGSILLMNLSWNFLQTTIQNKLAGGFDPQIYQNFNPLFETINKNTLAASFLISGIIFGLGLILIILSYALPHPPEPKPAPKPSQPQSQQPQPTKV